MYLARRTLAVVPARGGSKVIPRKNIRPLAGRPLIAYTIDQILAATLLDFAVVSTEDAEIKRVAQSLGIAVVDRPAELATDASPTEPALLHALDVVEAAGMPPFDYVMVLEPTSPLRSARSIDGCIATIIQTDAASLLTVHETRQNIGFVEAGRFRPLVPGAARRRQDRKPFYVESSTVYVCRVDYLRRSGTLVAENWAAYVVPDAETVDINSAEDFVIAECLMNMRKEAP